MPDSSNHAHESLVAVTAATTVSFTTPIELPLGLGRKSQQQYDKEWQRYERFVGNRLTYLPGKDRPWEAQPLWDYLSYRAESCAPATIMTILSKLAHKSISYNYVLPLQKHERPTVLYKQVKRMVRQLQLQQAPRSTNRLKGSTPLGVEEVSAMLQMFAIAHEASFNRLPRACRHHVVATLMQHSAGLRFGHFIFREYTSSKLIWNTLGATLLTNWQRYPGKSTAAITFRFEPRWDCFYYDTGNNRHITAADVLRWHVASLHTSDLLFEPLPGQKADRGDRQRWLRAVFSLCYVASGPAMSAAMNITPHSFRGGMAVDMRTQGASFEQVAARGRWLSRRAVKLYANKCTLSTSCPPTPRIPFSEAQITQLNNVAVSRKQ